MHTFRRELDARSSDPSRRTWLYVPYDQLTASIGPLARLDPREAGIVLVEAPAKAARRPYHRQKLALVLANQRHFALEQAARGVAVRYEVARGAIGTALERVASEVGALTAMTPAERELRRDLEPIVARGGVRLVPHEGWLTTREDFLASVGSKPPWRLDVFYKHVRERTGILMRGGTPEGGRFSFDVENRKPWRGSPPAPEPLVFRPDAVTREVVESIASRYAAHPGQLDPSRLPATLADAEAQWRWALERALPQFGPYEDAMSTRSSTLFHTSISALLNLHRLVPARVVADAANAVDLPIASREGFVRQVLGWRELVRHVHVETDGFRRFVRESLTRRDTTRDGGFGAWRGEAWPTADPPIEPGACPSALGADLPVPPAFWGKASGLECLDHVVQGVLRDGYGHHITRLMILSNLATLLGVDPRGLTDWFWSMYVDAYDWVVEPNVLAMGTFAAGGLMTTKPYVSGSAYIDKMSDYCDDCAFDPKRSCPVTRLYWAFFARHAATFAKNPRTSRVVAALERRSAEDRAIDRATFEAVRDALAEGRELHPKELVLLRKPRRG